MISKTRVTVVCCSNNESQLQKELVASLETQQEPYELLVINNKNNEFTSCSSAYNHALKNVNTEFVVFAHQDITLGDPQALSRFVDYMNDAEIGDVFGVAGTQLSEVGVLTAIYHGADRRPAGKRHLSGMQKCDVIDECFFGGLTDTFLNYNFNESLCNGWHLYAVDICLRCRMDKHSVYVCDIPMEHSSTGTLSHSFYTCFKRLCKEYHSNYSEIYTTCECSKTGFWSRNLYCFFAELKLYIKRYILRR